MIGHLPPDYWENWKPTAENINSLPGKVKEYVHGLETLCDPASIIAENIHLKDEMRMFQAAFENEFNKKPSRSS